jgi:YegS/Rv2252/BmrU family lipid kinase
MAFARLIVNPAAGAGKTAREWPTLMVCLKNSGLRFDYVLTEAPGHAIELACEAVLTGYKFIVSVGGDGTVNEVVNGMCSESAGENIMLGIICTGTGSDYIRTLGIPRSPFEAIHHLLNPRKVTIDLGSVEYINGGKPAKRLFVNFAGVGIDAEITKATTQRFKKLGDKPSYLAGLFATMLTYRNTETTIKLDGEIRRQSLCEVLVCNGKYGGGSMLVAPEADPADGLFDVMTIKEMGKIEILRCFPTIYKGTHVRNPKVEMRRVKEIEVIPARPWPLQADGEVLGETPVKIRIIPKALNVAV